MCSGVGSLLRRIPVTLTLEVTCEGTPDAGRFWLAALGWSLVWDQDGETAIQSPRGGTKVAWAGSPVAPKREPNQQRFDLVPAAEMVKFAKNGSDTTTAARGASDETPQDQAARHAQARQARAGAVMPPPRPCPYQPLHLPALF